MNLQSPVYRLFVLLISFQLSFSASAEWSPVNPGANGLINGFCIYEDKLYVYGGFTEIAGIDAEGIAIWNGISWSTISGGVTGKISDMVVFSGDLYASGEFTMIGSVAVNNIAKYDGADWTGVGGGISRTGGAPGDGIGNNLKVYKNALYVSGWIDFAGTTPVNDIAKWDGVSWSALGTGVNNVISAMEVYNDELYVGGSFSTAGPVTSPNIAKWNGSTWSAVGSGTNSIVLELTNFKNTLYLSGMFSQAGGVTANRIAQWNGTSFSPLGSGVTGGGSYTMPYSLIGYQNELYAGGSFTSIGGTSVLNIARWDGFDWHPLQDGISNSTMDFHAVSSMIEYKGELYVGGVFNLAGGESVQNLAKWSTILSSKSSATFPKTQLLPNPVTFNGTISLVAGKDRKAVITIVDAYGKSIFSEEKFLVSGNTQINLENLNLLAGIYFVHIHSLEGEEVVPLVIR